MALATGGWTVSFARRRVGPSAAGRTTVLSARPAARTLRSAAGVSAAAALASSAAPRTLASATAAAVGTLLGHDDTPSFARVRQRGAARTNG